MQRRKFLASAAATLAAGATATCETSAAEKNGAEQTFAELETKLRPLATELGKPKPGEWLKKQVEFGQPFDSYLKDRPIRRGKQFSTIYLCLIGQFSAPQREILQATSDYLAIFYDAPVRVERELSLDKIPDTAKRKHPSGGYEQLHTTEILEHIIRPHRPEDALAYLAFTASDLWPGGEWNYVFGQARLKDRIGLWSIHRFGDPAEDAETRQLCLQRTLKTAAHETGHILTLLHCIAFQCGMNGVNHRAELDRTPLHFCPICLRKVCWNLQIEPHGYLQKLATFARENRLVDEIAWYDKVLKRLA